MSTPTFEQRKALKNLDMTRFFCLLQKYRANKHFLYARLCQKRRNFNDTQKYVKRAKNGIKQAKKR